MVATPHDAMVQKILRKVICVSYKIFGTRFDPRNS
jgi:hypothetical protein